MVREVLLAHFVCLVAGGDDNEGAMVGCFFLFNAYFVCEFLEKMESTLPFAVQLTEKQNIFGSRTADGSVESASTARNAVGWAEIKRNLAQPTAFRAVEQDCTAESEKQCLLCTKSVKKRNSGTVG
jgi:hypothetical protein